MTLGQEVICGRPLNCHFVDSRDDSKTGDEERLPANVYEQKPMIEAVFMPSKKSTVAIKMLLTATRERLSLILTQTRNRLDFWDRLYNLCSLVSFSNQA